MATARRCRTRCSSCGKPTPRAVTPMPPTSRPTKSSTQTFPATAGSRPTPQGRFHIKTIKPGPVPGRGNTLQAPHINVAFFARGLLRQLYTRIYFADEAANAADPLLTAIEDETARLSLHRASVATGGIYRFDIVLQGDGETAFLDI